MTQPDRFTPVVAVVCGSLLAYGAAMPRTGERTAVEWAVWRDARIAELERLESIMFGRSQVTEFDLLRLAKIESLKSLSLNNSDGRLSAAIAKLHRLRPDLEISG